MPHIRRPEALAAIAAALLLGGAAQAQSPALKAAVADSARAPAETAQDAARKPLEVLGFAGVKAGDVVIERFPGYGYYTRLMAKAVGPTGHVYVMLFRYNDGRVLDIDKAQPIADENPNVTLIPSKNAMPQAPAPVDLVLSIQNYHDLHVGEGADVNAPEMNKLAMAALKRGGRFVVIDHVAPAGAGATLAPKTHRIEPATARAEIEAAGFRFVEASDALKNSADPHTATVSDPSIAGRTDRFMMRFKKPG